MKVIHVISSVRREAGGPSASVVSLCSAQRQIGIDACLMVGDRSRPTLDIPAARLSAMAWLFGSIRTMDGQTIYHVHGLWNPLSTWAMRYLRRRSIPYVISTRGMLRPENMPSVKKRIWATLWEKKNVSGASVICFTSEDELEAANACRWELPPIALIPNPIDVHSGADDVRMDAKTGRIVLFVGRLAKVKRIDLLLRAIAVLKGEYPNVLLRLAGPDWEGKRAKYVAMAKELGIYGNVEFMGMQNGDQLRVSYRGADIVTLVSQRENFGMAAAEGMGAGLPAVLTKNVGLASDAQEAGAAIITEDSPESIAGAFYKLLTDNTLRHQMGVNARRLVLDKYSPPTVAKQMIEVYKWCLGQAEKPDCVILD